METLSPQDLTSLVTFRMTRSQNKLNAQTAYFLKIQSDLTLVEWRVLRLLSSMEMATMADLSRELDMDKGQLSKKLKSMIAKNLVEAHLNHQDHRKQNLRLTEHGHEIMDRLLPMMLRRQALLTKGVSEQDLNVFLSVLDRMDRNSALRELE